MQIIADLQLHSKYSRAVSPKMDLDEIARWSAKKGIDVVATGDWTHPLWFREVVNKLKETTEGLYELKDNSSTESLSDSLKNQSRKNVKFLLSTEISSIYTQGGRARRVHNLIFSPSIETCKKIIDELTKRRCNLLSDGRPIVGISSKDLLELSLEIDKNILFIPAHAWTPWFSIFGSKSGFDSIKDCFGELAKYIYAIETGLSSDPLMNWQITELDNRSILSFSDAHSGPKLGREATVFSCNTKHLTCNINYLDISNAIQRKKEGHLKIGYTIEFFPEEGKYHFTGHRDCDVRLTPEEVEKQGIICPKCRRPLTVGVEEQVRKLASRKITAKDAIYIENKNGVTFVYDKEKKRVPFISLVPLLEILTKSEGSPTKAANKYEELVNGLGTEFDILLRSTLTEIEKDGGAKLAEAIAIVRQRKVIVDPGYDGVFGKVEIFKEQKETIKNEKQQALF